MAAPQISDCIDCIHDKLKRPNGLQVKASPKKFSQISDRLVSNRHIIRVLLWMLQQPLELFGEPIRVRTNQAEEFGCRLEVLFGPGKRL